MDALTSVVPLVRSLTLTIPLSRLSPCVCQGRSTWVEIHPDSQQKAENAPTAVPLSERLIPNRLGHFGTDPDRAPHVRGIFYPSHTPEHTPGTYECLCPPRDVSESVHGSCLRNSPKGEGLRYPWAVERTSAIRYIQGREYLTAARKDTGRLSPRWG